MAEKTNLFTTEKRKTKSPVWQFFELLVDNGAVDSDSPRCKLCNKNVSAKQGNTSNLHTHMKLHHPVEFSRISKIGCKNTSTNAVKKEATATQPSVVDSFAQGNLYERGGKRWKTLTDSVTRCLGKDMLPIYTVEKEGFVSMLKAFDSRYKMPSRKYFSQEAIPALYNKTRDSVSACLQNIQYFAATTDMWSSLTSEPYMSFTVHFIDSNWNLHTKCLETIYTPEDHTGDNLGDGMRQILSSWCLDEDKMVAVTSDNGSNIIKAVETNGWTRMSCFGHRLHLAVGNSLKDESRINRAFGVGKKVITHFSHSWKKKRDLCLAQAELSLPSHTLVTDCDTRWGSKQKMIARLLEQEKAISKVLSADRKASHLIPTWQDIDVFESVNAALEPLAEFTDILSGEKHITISYVKPVLKLFESDILKPCATDTKLTSDMKARILTYLKDKFSDDGVSEIIEIATFLDPRFKASYLDNIEGLKSKIKNEVATVNNIPKSDKSRPESAPEVTTNTAEVGQPETLVTLQPPPKKRKSLSDFFKSTRKTEQNSYGDFDARICRELETYMNFPTISQDADPLTWWKANHELFPLLANVARKFLCIPATSSSSERVFSTAGNIVTNKRACLNPTKVNMLVFLSKNL